MRKIWIALLLACFMAVSACAEGIVCGQLSGREFRGESA